MLGNLLYRRCSIVNSAICGKTRHSESEVEQVYIDKVPLKRGCDYQDVLNVLNSMPAEAAYCTGQSINIAVVR